MITGSNIPFERMSSTTAIKMLIDAVNNRTRERNYYILYSRFLEKEISEEEFNQELEANTNKYVISTDISPSVDEMENAILLAEHIMDIDTLGSIESLFSFRQLSRLS